MIAVRPVTNVLLTCVGRRNYLVRYFEEALAGRGEVFGADASPDAAGLRETHRAFVVPTVDEVGYVDHLLHLCRDHKVRLLISLNDLELPVLAERAADFHAIGTIPVVSSPGVIELCFDKWATYSFLRDHGIQVPRTFLTLKEADAALERGQISFPLIIKPRWGTASIGIDFPQDREELEMTYTLLRKRLSRTILGQLHKADPNRCVLIQEMLPGQEYNLDIINDLKGQTVAALVKRKLTMRAGETERALALRHEELEAVGMKVGQAVGHVGNLDCDVFHTDQGFFVIDLNPRFGGGYPFSHVAGANLPAALIAWALDEVPDPRWFQIQTSTLATKCDKIVVVRQEK